MKVIVCIKQVPQTAEVKIDPQTHTLIREGVESIINPFDMYAIEEAVRLKEKFGFKTVVLTMGPPQAEQALREALSMGIDEAVHLSDKAFAGSDTFATSKTLSSAIKKIGDYVLILCGKQASDGDTAQVGPGIAEWLGLPQICYVKRIRELNILQKYVIAERMLEEGYEVIKTSLPALFTVVKEINQPRLPSFRDMLRAKKAQITLWTHQDLNLNPQEVGLKGSPTQVIDVFTPPPREGGKIIQALDSFEGLEEVVELLRKNKK